MAGRINLKLLTDFFNKIGQKRPKCSAKNLFHSRAHRRNKRGRRGFVPPRSVLQGKVSRGPSSGQR
jgi:hypothetical protein